MASPLFLYLLELTALFSGTREHKCSLTTQITFCSGTMLYAYDDTVGECKLRNYLCPGTPNTFSRLRDCEAHCTESDVPAQCLLPKLIGPCHGLFFRFYYNSSSGDCEKFDYGGCGSNANNFVTLKECKQTCKVSNQTTKQNITVASENDGIINATATNSTSSGYRALRSTQNISVDDRKSGTPILENLTNAEKPVESFSNADQSTSSIPIAGFKVKPTRLPSNVSEPTSSTLVDGYGIKPTGLPSSVKGLAPPIIAGSYKVTPNGLPSNESESDSSILADVYKVNPTGLPSNANESTSYIPVDGYETEPPMIDAVNITGDDEKISSVENTPTGSSKNITRGKRWLIDNASTLYGQEKYKSNSTRENGDHNPINVCHLPNEHGPCDLDRVRYYYSQESKKCRLFIYGGCNGNGNNFETIGECVSRCEPNRCTHSEQVGICNQHFKRYFYDSKTKSCLPFIYSGCGGNSNNFPTFRSCQVSCVTQKYNQTHDKNTSYSVCELIPEEKSCPHSPGQLRFYYNSSIGRCMNFEMGKCGSDNGNNFHSLGECQKTCVATVCLLPRIPSSCGAVNNRTFYYDIKTDTCKSFSKGTCGANLNSFADLQQCKNKCVKDICKLNHDSGMCLAYFPKYYYNYKAGQCDSFIYGGCGGNENRFDTIEVCQERCQKNMGKSNSTFQNDHMVFCSLPHDTGPCRASYHRYYYNSTLGKCTNFTYGGCKGNANNFISMKDCQQACPNISVNVCSLPHDTGPCRANYPRYYYNSTLGKCTKFTYGGCKGNANNFISMKDCQQACPNISVNVCSLPHDTGPCRANYPRYYYNSTLGKCTKFTYGGCKGNANNFISMTDCQQACPNISVNVCSLPHDTGPCRANYPRYYYNSTLGKCTKFTYGGCKGNANNFISMTDCQQACPNISVNVCSLPHDTGPCRANYPRYYYNSTLGKCTKFTYGGCKGNANNFISMTDCQQACPNISVNVCSLPHDTGPCRANYPRYYFNSTLGKCTKFTYGGCKGNANNFISMTDCQQTCPNISVNVCSLLHDTGPCRANYPRYYYNSTLGKCTKFTYGGCKGNANNFISMTDCQQACPNISVNVCSLPHDTGPCRANYPRYYYNSTLGKCTKFTYGGCKGNANIFISMTDCQQACPNISVNVCSLPHDTGPCRANYPRYYYNSTLGKCTKFTYGGCKGNANNFISMTDCQQACPNISVNVCSLPHDTGPCRANYPRYYYNSTLGKCTKFTYGGCKGNANNFISMTDCQQACPNISVNVCSLPHDTGPCRANYPRYYYNSTLGKCTKFTYGGCKGNANNFISMTDCQQACPNISVNVCSLPHDTGPCRANYPRYYFNSTLGKCTKFTYGGCKGNANNFISMTDCQQTCPNISVNVCSLLHDTGPCRANYPRYYYNSTLGKCTKFTYGGCKGNANNFISMTDCQQACPNISVNVCSLPHDTGPCRANYPRYYYNSTLGKCTKFTYGGCKGNANNFISMTDCQQACPNISVNVCSLPHDTGPCRANYPRYYYNSTLGKCTKFTYGGCKGNANNFISMTDCQQACPNISVNVCSLPHDKGPCRANYPRYYYNSTLGKCTKFTYGGCKGNANNFISMTDCQQACPNISVNVCSLPHDTGPCRANYPRYYYNSTLGKCTKFTYGGCKGNANNFISMTDCQQACPNISVNVCSLPHDTGPCRANYPRYYYNSTLGKCTKFTYGGCKGNANNFISMTDCQQACQNISVNVCSLPHDTGPCRANYPRYYYNSTLGKCTKFTYGGCKGNANNFISMTDCRQTCPSHSGNVCSLPTDTGPCLASHLRYYYNSTLGKCTTFIYGGCKGNANNFVTMTDCKQTCNDNSVNVCSLPPDTGPCRAGHQRYYYNSHLGKCTTFIYGGCQGNANNFITMTDCQQTCLNDPCDQPLKVGPCKSRIQRFYFNPLTSNCEGFDYGGCGANKNNFKTVEECQKQCARDPCSLYPDAGTCNHSHKRFYFDLEMGRCLNFTYSGCGGNANRFSSVKQCRETCMQNRCEKDMDAGGCDKDLTRFFYDSKSKQCVSFLYGGCGGNTNNFLSAKHCKDACNNENLCLQPKMSGPCGAIFRRFYYDSVEGKCSEFNYGGCQGNKNNFHSLSECQNTCTPKTIVNKCHLQRDQGHCSSSEQRFYYNSTLDSCEPFMYTGCAGNANNFLSERQCERECRFDRCKQPRAVGSCSGNERRWYFDETFQLCRPFNYRGCGGNHNNFQSLENCEQQCVSPTCRLKMATGSCNQSLHRFYYNWEHGRCYRFNYTGCHGNENRFLSMKHCEETCSIDPCLQPLSNVGRCSRATKKYFYNRNIGACQSFTFWGCQKNGNNFDNVIECHKSCQHMYEFDRRR